MHANVHKTSNDAGEFYARNNHGMDKHPVQGVEILLDH